MSTLQVSPSELAFKKHAEFIRISLQTFNALHAISASGVVSSPLHFALTELVNSAICDLLHHY